MANIQNTPSDQAGTGPAGGTAGAETASAEPASAGSTGDGRHRPRRGKTAGTSAGHTTAGAGTGADLTDILTDGDGGYDGDADMRTDGAEIIGGSGNADLP